MDLQALLNEARQKAASTARSVSDLMGAATNAVGNGFSYAKESLTQSWLFGSTEQSLSEFDEKHYFLIPYRLAECGYTLYSMRCLPEGVPPVNDLPKRRIIHLPNEHGQQMIEQLLCDEAAHQARTEEQPPSFLGAKLTDLADGIDQLDKTAFQGALLIGGLVALANPVAGGMLAAKAMLPSLGLFLSRYGLQQVGDTLNERGLQKKIANAEKDVLSQFRGSKTLRVVDPLLVQLDKALNTTQFEYDPVVESPSDLAELYGQLNAGLTVDASVTAILKTYDQLLKTSALRKDADLGPEDVRWLEMLQNIQRAESA